MDSTLIIVSIIVFVGLLVILVMNGRKKKKLERDNEKMMKDIIYNQQSMDEKSYSEKQKEQIIND